MTDHRAMHGEMLRELFRRRPEWVRQGLAVMFANVGQRIGPLMLAFDAEADCETVRKAFAALIMSLGALEADHLLGTQLLAALDTQDGWPKLEGQT